MSQLLGAIASLFTKYYVYLDIHTHPLWHLSGVAPTRAFMDVRNRSRLRAARLCAFAGQHDLRSVFLPVHGLCTTRVLVVYWHSTGKVLAPGTGTLSVSRVYTSGVRFAGGLLRDPAATFAPFDGGPYRFPRRGSDRSRCGVRCLRVLTVRVRHYTLVCHKAEPLAPVPASLVSWQRTLPKRTLLGYARYTDGVHGNGGYRALMGRRVSRHHSPARPCYFPAYALATHLVYNRCTRGVLIHAPFFNGHHPHGQCHFPALHFF